MAGILMAAISLAVVLSAFNGRSVKISLWIKTIKNCESLVQVVGVTSLVRCYGSLLVFP